mgnify:CR=1 FL=1
MQSPSKGSSKSTRAELESLYKENLGLREDLKQINKHLNKVIERLEAKRNHNKKSKPQQTTPEELELVKKKLTIYENEYKFYSKKVQKCSDPHYEYKLKSQIENAQKILTQKETAVKNSEKIHKQKEKAIDLILESNETEQIQKAYSELKSTLTFYSVKIQRARERQQRVQFSLQEADARLSAVEKRYNTFSSQTEPLSQIENKEKQEQLLKNEVNALEKAMNIKVKEYNSQIRKHKHNIKVLEEEFQKLKEEEQTAQTNIQLKNDSLQKIRYEMKNLHQSLESLGNSYNAVFITSPNKYL